MLKEQQMIESMRTTKTNNSPMKQTLRNSSNNRIWDRDFQLEHSGVQLFAQSQKNSKENIQNEKAGQVSINPSTLKDGTYFEFDNYGQHTVGS